MTMKISEKENKNGASKVFKKILHPLYEDRAILKNY